MTRIAVDRIPTSRELEQMYADQVAADWQRARAAYGARAGGPGALAGIDVSHPETLPPRRVEAVARPTPADVQVVATTDRTPRAFCKDCGKMFTHPRKATAKAMATKCAKTH